ncbi:MAG: hypothetical protein MMC33_010503 [Icmadophila ericetorum]|nr:hypothetical protein [Icmadophila ericetorum]
MSPSTRSKLDNIREIILSYKTIPPAIDQTWYQGYETEYARFMERYFPRRCRYVTIDARHYVHPNNHKKMRFSVGERWERTAWLRSMPHLMQFRRNVKVEILRREMVGCEGGSDGTDEMLEGRFPGMIIRLEHSGPQIDRGEEEDADFYEGFGEVDNFGDCDVFEACYSSVDAEDGFDDGGYYDGFGVFATSDGTEDLEDY